jgi:hypothetical protein
MKTTKAMLVLAVALAGFTAAGSALAQHHHFHGGPRVSIGFGFGLPFAAYPYYYPPYYAPYYSAYYQAPVVVQQQSPVYVEQNPQAAPSAQPSAPAGYWYYCASSRAYYPYVKECPAGWQRVAPQPG